MKSTLQCYNMCKSSLIQFICRSKLHGPLKQEASHAESCTSALLNLGADPACLKRLVKTHDKIRLALNWNFICRMAYFFKNLYD